MITGIVTEDGVPLIHISVGDCLWPAAIDTGFNGWLELSDSCRDLVNPLFLGRVDSELASGVKIEEDAFSVELPFDGDSVESEVTFVESDAILIGTALIANHHLEIDFPARTVNLERLE